MDTTYLKEPALVLFSGGQDSTTCLFWAMKKFQKVEAICFSYGQRHAREIELARSIASTQGIPFNVIDASVLGSMASNALTDHSVPIEAATAPGALPNTFVPGRNMVFLTLAAIKARTLGFRNLVTGVSQADFSGYPDCRDTFIRSLNVSLNLGMDESFIIHTPLMWLDKAGVWELSDHLGVMDIVRTQTLTCYEGIPGDGCGTCPSCILRRKGLETYLENKKKPHE